MYCLLFAFMGNNICAVPCCALLCMFSQLEHDQAETVADCRGTKALLIVQQVLQQSSMQELALFSLMASPKHKQLKIRLDKVNQLSASLLTCLHTSMHIHCSSTH